MTANSALPSMSRTSAKVPTYHAVSRSRSRSSAGRVGSVGLRRIDGPAGSGGRRPAGAGDACTWLVTAPAGDTASDAEPVSGATDRMDQLGLELVVDLTPQPTDQHFEHVCEWIMIVIPYVGGDGRPVDYDALVARE